MRFGLFLVACLLAAANAVAAPECATCQAGQCGVIPDGCGGSIQCGGCGGGDTCGGGGTANVCGSNAPCTGLCLQQTACPGTSETTISGVVSTPNGALPLANATVYVPNAELQPFAPDVACTTCGAEPSGSPLVSALSDAFGNFVLHDAPAGSNIPVVVQVGRWRHKAVIPAVPSCVNTAMSTVATQLPSTQGGGSDDNIPLIAVVTGASDVSECLLRDVGVADGQFSDPSGGGRIQFYDGGGAVFSASTPAESALFDSDFTLQPYDAVLLACHGTADAPTVAEKAVFTDFVDAGGRALVDHLEYPWLSANSPLDSLTTWNVEQVFTGADPEQADIARTFPKGDVLADWMFALNPTWVDGQVAVSHLANDYDGVVAPAVNWITGASSPIPLQFSFNTPVGVPAPTQCGRVAFLDHHPYFSSTAAGTTFPAECPAGPLTQAQELAIYTFFDATNCVWPDLPDGVVGTYNGDRQHVQPGAVIRNLQAQVLASDGSYPFGVPVSFIAYTLSGDVSATVANGIAITDGNGVVTAPPLTVGGTSGALEVLVDAHAAAPVAFTVYVGDELFYGGFDF